LPTIPSAARRTAAALGVLVLAATSACAGTAGAAVSLRVSGTPLKVRPIERGFLGLALEYRSIPGLVGTHPEAVDPVLLQLIRNLSPTSRPVLRIGGQSSDRTWWPVRGIKQPRGVTYDLSASWMERARALAAATNARLILGVGLEANQPRIDAVEAQQLLKAIDPRYVDELEIGNEPELYPVIPWYRVLKGAVVPWYSQTGAPVFSRSLSYSPADFAGEFVRVLKLLPRVPIAATGAPSYLAALNPLLSPSSPIKLAATHAYGLVDCVTDPASPQYPSVPNLLSTAAATADVAGISPMVGVAHRNRAGFRVDEMGSVSCNGHPGVSNSFASALWVIDALFVIASRGIDGVNLHTYPNSVNGLFDFVHQPSGWRGSVYPLYYGALMFAQAAPTGARLLPISPLPPAPLRWWATLGRDHRIRLVLINDSLRQGAQLRVSLPPGFTAGSLERLTAASAYATGGVTLGGVSFGTSTATGVLPPGRRQPLVVRGGTLTVGLPASSAALVTLP
jgi:hypothetical protein